MAEQDAGEKVDSADAPVPAGTVNAPADATLDDLGPSLADIDAWAERERARRRAWLDGPTEEEREAWAERERDRRRAEAGLEARASEIARIGRKYGRETQLATEGALALMMRLGRRTFDDLVQAGRDWEEDASRVRKVQRIRIDDDED